MEWLEITAPTVESAKERALVHLGVHESDAEFEVLSTERVGMFGRVKEEARVRARVVPTPVRPKEGRGRGHNSRKSGGGSSKRTEPARASTVAKSEPRPSGDENHRPPASSTPSPQSRDGSQETRRAQQRGSNNKKTEESKMDYDSGPSLLEQADLAESFVKGVGDTLGVPLAFTRHDIEDGILRIEADGEGIGLLVGRRGATAQAIDELVRTVLQRSGGSTREGKIRMDVGGIRARRTAALAEFTRKVAQEALDTGEEIALESMNRVDRKIVHDVVTGIDRIDSRSEGEDPHRRVIITALPD